MQRVLQAVLIGMTIGGAIVSSGRVDGSVTPSGDSTIGAGSTPTYIGRDANGSLVIDGGSSLTTATSFVGHAATATGTVVISGSGSRWTPSTINIGYSGRGIVEVAAGGSVSTNGSAALGYFAGASGTLSVGGAGAAWVSNSDLLIGRLGSGALQVTDGGLVTARTLYASPANLSGNGVISVKGCILDSELLFDASHGLTQTIPFGAGGSLNLALDGTGDLGAGHQGPGRLQISQGISVASRAAYLGAWNGSEGSATVTGAGSKWLTGVNNDFFNGFFGNGSLKIESAGEVSNRQGYIGFHPGSTGTTTVSGPGSKWSNRQQIWIGNRGRGTLIIENGGRVENSAGYVGFEPGSTGWVNISGAGSTWINSAELFVGYNGSGSITVANGGSVSAEVFYGSLSNLHGNGSVTASGAVLDGSLTFDSTLGSNQSMTFGSGGAFNLTGTSRLGAGFRGSGQLSISDGVVVTSAFSYLGFLAGSTGKATVRGGGSEWQAGAIRIGTFGNGILEITSGGNVEHNGNAWIGDGTGSTGTAIVSGVNSTWQAGSTFLVGDRGSGTLIVNGGAEVRCGEARVAANHLGSRGWVTISGPNSVWRSLTLSVGGAGVGTVNVTSGGRIETGAGSLGAATGSIGAVVVTGPGSRWIGDAPLMVGLSGAGVLTVSDSAKVNATRLSVNAQSSVRLHISGDNMIALGSSSNIGSVTNNGTMRFYADALLPAGVYRPVSEFAQRPMGWSGSGSFTGVGGEWNNTEKTFIVGAATQLSAGTTDPIATAERYVVTDLISGDRVGASFGNVAANAVFYAAPTSESSLISLRSLLLPEEIVLTSWDFSADFQGETLLSFDVGRGIVDPAIWRFDGTAWSRFTAGLQTYDTSGLLSIGATSLSSYAVTGKIPEPLAAVVLALNGAMIALIRRPRM